MSLARALRNSEWLLKTYAPLPSEEVQQPQPARSYPAALAKLQQSWQLVARDDVTWHLNRKQACLADWDSTEGHLLCRFGTFVGVDIDVLDCSLPRGF